MSSATTPPRLGFAALAAHTPARLAVGRTGTRLPWTVRAALLLVDAIGDDATREEVPRGIVTRLQLVELDTVAESRGECLDHPTDACRLAARARARLKRCRRRPDVQLVVCDGLAPGAVVSHARGLLAELRRLLRRQRYRQGTPLFVRNGRAAVAREIVRAVRPGALCLIVGQRPSTRAPRALTAHVLPAGRTGPAVTVRDIHPRGTASRAAARRLADALIALLGEAPRRRRRRP